MMNNGDNMMAPKDEMKLHNARKEKETKEKNGSKHGFLPACMSVIELFSPSALQFLSVLIIGGFLVTVFQDRACLLENGIHLLSTEGF